MTKVDISTYYTKSTKHLLNECTLPVIKSFFEKYDIVPPNEDKRLKQTWAAALLDFMKDQESSLQKCIHSKLCDVVKAAKCKKEPEYSGCARKTCAISEDETYTDSDTESEDESAVPSKHKAELAITNHRDVKSEKSKTCVNPNSLMKNSLAGLYNTQELKCICNNLDIEIEEDGRKKETYLNALTPFILHLLNSNKADK